MPTLVWQILPPLLMLALLAVPMEPFVFVFWLGGFFAAAYSAIKLLRMGMAVLRKRPVDSSRAIRPALTLALLAGVAVVAYGNAVADGREADEFGRRLAQQMKTACDRDGKCAPAPPGWTTNEHGHSRNRHNHTRIDYKVLPDLSAFRITVHHPLEFMRDFEAGVGKPIVEREVIR
jgi:hypothetical protein